MASNIISIERSIEINDPNFLYTCTKCNIQKPNYEFSRDNSKKIKRGRKYVTQCKKCRVLHSKTNQSKLYREATRKIQLKKT